MKQVGIALRFLRNRDHRFDKPLDKGTPDWWLPWD